MEELDTREKILQEAANLFMKYGIRSISMDDIAHHLSMSKKTLYQHFADKDELVNTVVKLYMEQQKKLHDDIAHKSENAIDELYKIGACIRTYAENSSPSALFDIQKFHPKVWSTWVDFKTKYIHNMVARNIKQGIKEGYFRAEVNVDIFAQYRISMIEVIHDDVSFPKNKFNHAEVHTQLFEHFIYGLCTEKGKKLYEKYKNNKIPQLNKAAL